MREMFVNMSLRPELKIWVFYVLSCSSVLCYVPPPTNLSIVCHNLVNVLYWNYSRQQEQVEFNVTLIPYSSKDRGFEVSETHLDISAFTSDVGDSYLLTVSAHAGPEKSEALDVGFSYRNDLSPDDQRTKCSLDFPAVNASVLQDEIHVWFIHPSYLWGLTEYVGKTFVFKVTHEQQEWSFRCEDDPCSAVIHLKQSIPGECVDLKLEGTVSSIPLDTYSTVCAPVEQPRTDRVRLVTASLVGGGLFLLILLAVVLLFCKRWSKFPKIPEVLLGFVHSGSSATQPESADQSLITPMGHTPLLVLPDETCVPGQAVSQEEEEEPEAITITREEEEEEPEVITITREEEEEEPEVNDSHWFTQEMSPGDVTEGYGPRPPVL